MLNLSLKSLTDPDVEHLFSALPFHCIIMLEDVDATKPLQRKLKAKDDGETETVVEAEGTNAEDGVDDKMALLRKTLGKGSLRVPTMVVTLSGLLNAIDGIGASEGRILIMSTNKIEDLDEALIRAGRADRIINFTNTTKEQAQNMFVSAYTGTRWQPHTAESLSPFQDPEVEECTEDKISALAKEFSRKIHNEAFSPALLQQYFKDFRAQLRLAIQELDKWMAGPRAYLKPSLAIPMSIKKAGRLSVPESDVMVETLVSAAAKEDCSAVADQMSLTDLMSLDDLGGYEEPLCFEDESDDSIGNLSGSLVDVSSCMEAY